MFLSKDTTHRVHHTLPPSLSSTSDPGVWRNATRGRNNQLGPSVKPSVEIFVIAVCNSRCTIKKWPGGTLKDKNLSTIFDEVSELTSGNEIQKIKFKLETLKKENNLECLIERGDVTIFEVMIQKLNDRMKERKKAGEGKFKILLEAIPEQQGAEKAKVTQDSESDGELW